MRSINAKSSISPDTVVTARLDAEGRRTGKLELPTDKALADQFRSLDLVRGAGGKLTVTPGVLPLVDAILLTLQPLLRTATPVRGWVGR